MATHPRPEPGTALRRGWTTGACATAAAKAALTGLLTDTFPDPVSIELPKGQTPAFPLALEERGGGFARAGIVKDAGDDPDVTHGATVIARVSPNPDGGIAFRAGEGVGTVTKAGLPIPPDEAAINPVPRRLIAEHLEAVSAEHGVPNDWTVEIAIPGGEALAERTWNPRLGIVGGLSILGTTGIVNPFSCAAWIHSIHRGVDVARAEGLTRILAATGSTSEASARAEYPDLPLVATIDMGDFAGGLLKYLREHPVPRLVLAGGFAKMSKLAAGALDLHSGRGGVDLAWLAGLAPDGLRARIEAANTGAEALSIAGEAGVPLGQRVAELSRATALDTLRGAPVAVETIVTDRAGAIVGRAP